MGITAIDRNYVGVNSIVFIITTDDLVTITTAGYFSTQKANINLIQNGDFVFNKNDLTIIYYSPDQLGFFRYDFVNDSFDVLAPPGDLSNVLSNGNIFVGNASNIATGVSPSGDITLTNTGVFDIASNVVMNADINSSAGISFSKLEALPSSQILVGDAGNVATATAMTGDINIDNTGLTTIQSGVIDSAKIATSAGIQLSQLEPLFDGNIIVGNASNVASSVTMSGNVTIDNSGLTTIQPSSINLAMLSSGITPSALIKFNGQLTTVGGSPTEAFTVTGALGLTDTAFCQMVDDGTNNVTILYAQVTDDTLTVIFSADPGNDAIFNFQLIRNAS